MRKFLNIDFVLAFVIVCIAMTLTVVVAFAMPREPCEMHPIHRALTTKELSQ